MENQDILIRLRYALDIKDTDMVEIFKLGGIQLTKEEVQKMLTKQITMMKMKQTIVGIQQEVKRT